MYWRDVVILRAVVTDTDADGYPAEVVKETRVFADVQSVKRTEFYAAKQIGIDLAITVKVRYGDYGNQNRLLFSGKEYKVERAYTDAREFYTLECSEFKEASA